MPALGDRITMGFDKIDKSLCAYMICQQHPTIQKVKKQNYKEKKHIAGEQQSSIS